MDKRAAIKTANLYLDTIRGKYKFSKAYLFGSYSRGISHKDSDIDIAIVFTDLQDYFNMQLELMRLRRSIDTRIEPHPIDENDFNVSNPLAAEIIRYGIELTPQTNNKA